VLAHPRLNLAEFPAPRRRRRATVPNRTSREKIGTKNKKAETANCKSENFSHDAKLAKAVIGGVNGQNKAKKQQKARKPEALGTGRPNDFQRRWL